MGQSSSIEHPKFTPEDALKMSQIVRMKSIQSKSRDNSPSRNLSNNGLTEQEVARCKAIRQVNKSLYFFNDFLLLTSSPEPNDMNINTNPLLAININSVSAPTSPLNSSKQSSSFIQQDSVKSKVKRIVSKTQQSAAKEKTFFKEMGKNNKYERFSFAGQGQRFDFHNEPAKVFRAVGGSQIKELQEIPIQQDDDAIRNSRVSAQFGKKPSGRETSSEERVPHFGHIGKESKEEKPSDTFSKKREEDKNRDSVFLLRENVQKIKNEYDRSKSAEKPDRMSFSNKDAFVFKESKPSNGFVDPLQDNTRESRYGDIKERVKKEMEDLEKREQKIVAEKPEIAKKEPTNEKVNDTPRESSGPYSHLFQSSPISGERKSRKSAKSPSHGATNTNINQDQERQPTITDYLTKKNQIRGHSPKELDDRQNRSQSPVYSNKMGPTSFVSEQPLIPPYGSIPANYDNRNLYSSNYPYQPQFDPRLSASELYNQQQTGNIPPQSSGAKAYPNRDQPYSDRNYQQDNLMSPIANNVSLANLQNFQYKKPAINYVEDDTNSVYESRFLNSSIGGPEFMTQDDGEFSPVNVNLNLQDLLNESQMYNQNQPMQKNMGKPQQPPQTNMVNQNYANIIYSTPPQNRQNQMDHQYSNMKQNMTSSPYKTSNIHNEQNFSHPDARAQGLPVTLTYSDQKQPGPGSQYPQKYYSPPNQNVSYKSGEPSTDRKDKNYESRYVRNPIFAKKQLEMPPDLLEMSQSILMNNLELQASMMQKKDESSRVSKWDLRNGGEQTGNLNKILPSEYTNGSQSARNYKRNLS